MGQACMHKACPLIWHPGSIVEDEILGRGQHAPGVRNVGGGSPRLQLGCKVLHTEV